MSRYGAGWLFGRRLWGGGGRWARGLGCGCSVFVLSVREGGLVSKGLGEEDIELREGKQRHMGRRVPFSSFWVWMWGGGDFALRARRVHWRLGVHV